MDATSAVRGRRRYMGWRPGGSARARWAILVALLALGGLLVCARRASRRASRAVADGDAAARGWLSSAVARRRLSPPRDRVGRARQCDSPYAAGRAIDVAVGAVGGRSLIARDIARWSGRLSGDRCLRKRRGVGRGGGPTRIGAAAAARSRQRVSTALAFHERTRPSGSFAVVDAESTRTRTFAAVVRSRDDGGEAIEGWVRVDFAARSVMRRRISRFARRWTDVPRCYRRARWTGPAARDENRPGACRMGCGSRSSSTGRPSERPA